MFTGDVSLVGLYQPRARRKLLNGHNRGVPVNLSAPVACALRQCLRQVSRLDVTVIRMLDCSQEVIRFTKWPDFLDLLWGQLVDFHANSFGNSGVIHELVPAVLGAGKTDIGHFPETHMLAGFSLQFAIELHRVFVNLTDRIGQVEERQQARRMPGRARREFLALHQDHVAPALFGQVIEGRNANHTAANNNNPRLRFHGKSFGVKK